jgi:hypothetical protein
MIMLCEHDIKAGIAYLTGVKGTQADAFTSLKSERSMYKTRSSGIRCDPLESS